MTASFGATSILLTKPTLKESETETCRPWLKFFVDFPLKAMVSKKRYRWCAQRTLPLSLRTSVDLLTAKYIHRQEKLLQKHRVVEETCRKCLSWTSYDIRQGTIPQDSHAQLVDAPKLCECKQGRCGKMRSIIPTNSDAFNSKYLSRTSAMLPDSVHS